MICYINFGRYRIAIFQLVTHEYDYAIIEEYQSPKRTESKYRVIAESREMYRPIQFNRVTKAILAAVYHLNDLRAMPADKPLMRNMDLYSDLLRQRINSVHEGSS